MRFVVLGAGVVGLTTALELQKQYPYAQISIIAEKFGENTTSDIAAGIFRPGPSFSGPDLITTRKWITDSYNYWFNLSRNENASMCGVAPLSVYCFSSTDKSIVQNHFLENLLPLYRECTNSELKLCPGDWKYGSFYTTIITECRLYQAWAQRRFEINGGKIETKFVPSLGDFSATDYEAVFNCTGLGAQKLCNDIKVVPMRGQIVKVHAPWVKTAFYADYDTYILPGLNGNVTLGGTRQYDSYNIQIDKFDSLSIRERCESLLPSLANAPVVCESVGLRPYRSSVRVESELVTDLNGKSLLIIHNYGHGGYGVTSAPGTAIAAVDLLNTARKNRSKL